MQHTPQIIFLVGAARSGTKLLRTILSQSTHIGSIPYDINYIWKYGHYSLEHDEMNDLEPTSKQISFIQNFIYKQAKRQNKPFVIEKTVSNTLRVDYIKKVFPEAKIIHLYRDGRDVALSAKQRWEGSIFDKEQQSKKEIFQKILSLPLIHVSPYLIEYIKTNLKHMIGITSHVDTWGPVYKGMQQDASSMDLLSVCGKQWSKSVESTLTSLTQYTENVDYISIKYEEILSQPQQEIIKIATFLNLQDSYRLETFAKRHIKSENKQKWKSLPENILRPLESQIGTTLLKLGYEPMLIKT